MHVCILRMLNFNLFLAVFNVWANFFLTFYFISVRNKGLLILYFDSFSVLPLSGSLRNACLFFLARGQVCFNQKINWISKQTIKQINKYLESLAEGVKALLLDCKLRAEIVLKSPLEDSRLYYPHMACECAWKNSQLQVIFHNIIFQVMSFTGRVDECTGILYFHSPSPAHPNDNNFLTTS